MTICGNVATIHCVKLRPPAAGKVVSKIPLKVRLVPVPTKVPVPPNVAQYAAAIK